MSALGTAHFPRLPSPPLPGQVVRAAADGDRAKVLRKSRDLRFMTGLETKVRVAVGGRQWQGGRKQSSGTSRPWP